MIVGVLKDGGSQVGSSSVLEGAGGGVSTEDSREGSWVEELASLGEQPLEGPCLPAALAAEGTERERKDSGVY